MVIEEVWQVFVRIQNNEGWTNVSKDLIFFVPFNKVVEYFRLVEYCHVTHILEKFAFGGYVEGVCERDGNLCST